MLAITGMQETSVLGTGYQQEVHTEQLYDDLAEYNLVVGNPPSCPAWSTSRSGPRWPAAGWPT